MSCACQLNYDVRVFRYQSYFVYQLIILTLHDTFINDVKKAFLTNAFLYDNNIVLISFQLPYIVCIVLCNGKIYAIFQSLKLYPVFFVIKNRKTWLTLFKKNHFVLFSHVNHNQQWSESFFTNPDNTYPHFCSTANNRYEDFWLILTMIFKLQIHKSSFYTLISESIHL